MKSIAAAVSASFLLLAACGPASPGGGGGGTDGGTPPPEFPAQHAAYPEVVDHGGAVLARPRVVTITFTGYNYTSQVQQFAQKVVGSKWLKAAGEAYGVGNGTYEGSFEFSNGPNVASDTGTANFIEQHIQAGDLPKAAPGEDPILYMVFYSPGVPILSGYHGSASCSTFAGFHSEADFTGDRFPYAVLPECPGDFSKWSYIESAASHELIEAATDPWYRTAPGWFITDVANPWSYLGGEVGDECIGLDIVEDGETYQRTWSNSAAKAGNADPCVPAGTAVQFGVTPTAARIVWGQQGQDLKVPIHGWSAAKRSDWHVQAFTWSEDWDGQPQMDTATMNNGDTVHLDVHVPANAPHNGNALYFVIAWSDDGGSTFWPVRITIR